MEPITEAQEWTLRRWVATKGNRKPGKRDKAFLHAEKGLSGEQIDFWWENVEPSKHRENTADLPASSMYGNSSNNPIQDSSLLNSSDHNPSSSRPFHSDAQFVALNMDMDFSQEIQNWSPIEFPQDEIFPTIESFNTDSSEQYSSWLSTESQPLLSSATSHGINMSRVERSSYSSSVRTWDTASTLVSVYDPKLDGMILDDMETDIKKTIKPTELDKKKSSYLASRSSGFKPIPEEDGSPWPFSSSDTKTPSSSKDAQKDTVKTVKSQPTYLCTVCRRAFSRKGDWRRHEESHDPQTYWICMLTDPAIHVSSGWMCVFCDSVKANRSDIVLHLTKRHKINECTNRHISNRKWGRKDKLKQHLQQMHNLAEGATEWNGWHCEPPKRKWAWGCGFCGGCSFTWEGRVTHIAEHYERQNINSLQWSPSLVVKGLLKQVYPDFDVASAWRTLIGGAPNGDRYLQWSKDEANNLRRKLEFHEGTPGAIAAEAQAIAAELVGDADNFAWTEVDSRVPTLTSPIDYAEIEKGSWGKDSKSGMSQPERSCKQTPAASGDFGLSNGVFNFI